MGILDFDRDEQRMAEVLSELDRQNAHNHQNFTGYTGYTGGKPCNTGVSGVPGTPGTTGYTGYTPGDSEEMPPGFTLKRGGLYFTEENKEGDTEERWIASAIHVKALTRNVDSEAWGRLLEFEDSDGKLHVWPCPMEMFASDCAEFRRTLLAMGAVIAPGRKARDLLATYVQTVKIQSRAICSPSTGWHSGAYVLPEETIGEGAERVLLQTTKEPPKMRRSGEVSEWRDHIGRYCVGNSRMALSVSMAFAAPLLEMIGQESGGVHIVGGSSIGKTASVRCAASVWGDEQFINRWRATTNGLEATAQAHNDGLLILDELAQIDPRQAGESSYLLANGAGKHRARRDGLARPAATWRLLFLSTGEIKLADHMAEAGKRAKAGQDVRMADVPAEVGEYGAFETIHDAPDSAQFAKLIERNVARYYGSPIREYLHQLTGLPRDSVRDRIDQIMTDFIEDAVPEGAAGQVRRVAARFALIAAGGELATAFGITGWPKGEAIKAAQTCFSAWMNQRGGAGAQEFEQAIAQVRHFLESHGNARFEDPAERERIIPNQAGIRRVVDNEMQYLIYPETFKREVCVGMNPVTVAKALREAGHLVVNDVSHNTIQHRGHGRMYCVREAIHA